MTRLLLRATLMIVATVLAVGGALAQTSGLPLPRFVSLRSDEVNLRSGPGQRYPVDWIYARRDLPVEVVAEFEVWRKIRDWQGTEGWVHQTMLSGRRMLVVTNQTRQMRATESEDSPVVALVEPSVIGRVVSCPRGKVVCQVEIQTIVGWMRRDYFWGVYASEWIE